MKIRNVTNNINSDIDSNIFRPIYKDLTTDVEYYIKMNIKRIIWNDIHDKFENIENKHFPSIDHKWRIL